MIPFIHAALHGHFSLGQLWSQYGEPRIPLVRAYLLLFAEVDHLDVRAAIISNAVLFIVSYGILLALFRRYLGASLTPIPVLAVGLVWLSWADVQNALWAFEIGWYLVTLGFVATLAALVLPRHRHDALAGCGRPVRGPRHPRLDPGIRRVADRTAVPAVVPDGPLEAQSGGDGLDRPRRSPLSSSYLIGYDRSITSCVPAFGCKPTDPITHPVSALRFLVVLVGNVVPGGFTDGLPHEFRPVRDRRRRAPRGRGVRGRPVVEAPGHQRTDPPATPPRGLRHPRRSDTRLGPAGIRDGGAVESNRYVMPNVSCSRDRHVRVVPPTPSGPVDPRDVPTGRDHLVALVRWGYWWWRRWSWHQASVSVRPVGRRGLARTGQLTVNWARSYRPGGVRPRRSMSCQVRFCGRTTISLVSSDHRPSSAIGISACPRCFPSACRRLACRPAKRAKKVGLRHPSSTGSASPSIR